MEKNDLTIILLTYNEEANLPACLESLKGLNYPIFAVDSFSTDKTLSILESQQIKYVQHSFDNYSLQRNWAQENNPFETKWVFHLDAGERLTPELVNWLNSKFDPNTDIEGYMFSRRTIFLGKWIKYGGHYPNFHLRLYQANKGKCEEKVYDQHFVVNGKKEIIKTGIDIIDTVTDTLLNFTTGHARWAVFEALEIVSSQKDTGDVKAKLFGNPIERRRWLKQNLFERSPLFVRSFLYFFYRFIIKMGFLDGTIGLVFHLLQGFWFRFLIDAIILEIKTKVSSGNNILLKDLIKEEYGDKYYKLLESKNIK
ncbi:glycosyltransferase family 2 protein [Chondrinema litorale]|uniref:glycosyltransferase family 2 protein n=1 Tax=Chondrinema litorale TaxID=2994555 RepID=UPI0025429156|nr:glycosyltransferase family 2 protein [Chondrinema litorale]UZR95492.1 glycosyltransferase family 2 protein [Chondrinema litorale]